MNSKNKTGNLHQITLIADVFATGYTNCDKFSNCIHCIENFITIYINLQNKTHYTKAIIMNQKKKLCYNHSIFKIFFLAWWLSNKKYVEALGIHNHIQITFFRCLKARQENLIIIIIFINSDKILTRNNYKKDDPNWAGWLLKDTSSFDASWLRNAPKGWNDLASFMPSSLHQ